MKDKRKYLKIAAIIEFIYIPIMTIYYLLFNKINDEVIANLFMLYIGLIFGIILYKESKEELNYLKENKIKIIVSSIWLFLEPIIPGILGFMFLSSLKEKKMLEIPIIKEENKNIKDIIKSVVVLLMFVFLMFVFPLFNIYNKIHPIFIYAFIFIGLFLVYTNDIKNNFIIFKNNIKKYIPFIIKRYFIMLGLMVVVAMPIVLINKGDVSSNQQAINEMFSKIPFLTFVLTSLYAPFAEETIFRLSLSKLIKNKYVFIIISGLLFGTLHIIDKFTSIYDLLYILQYSTLGFCLAKAYKDTNNIFVPISMHFIQNFLASILSLLLLV